MCGHIGALIELHFNKASFGPKTTDDTLAVYNLILVHQLLGKLISHDSVHGDVDK